MIKVGILGAGSHVAGELIKLLLSHKEVEIGCLVSQTFGGQKLEAAHPALKGLTNISFQSYKDAHLEESGIVFVAKPHTYFKEIAELLTGGIKIIDFGADFRLKKVETFEQWYNMKHPVPELLPGAVYGLPELNKEKIKSAKLLANPGCYPAGIILGVAPLFAQILGVDTNKVIIDSVSGFSGAGRREGKPHTLAIEVYNNLKAYKVGIHPHIPEMEQELQLLSGKKTEITFVPHVAGFERGILNTIHFPLEADTTTKRLIEAYDKFYADAPFIRVCRNAETAEIKNVVGTNFCDIELRVNKEKSRLVILSAIDNLVKGASGQAVQNMNLMFGFDETEGLL